MIPALVKLLIRPSIRILTLLLAKAGSLLSGYLRLKPQAIHKGKNPGQWKAGGFQRAALADGLFNLPTGEPASFNGLRGRAKLLRR